MKGGREGGMEGNYQCLPPLATSSLPKMFNSLLPLPLLLTETLHLQNQRSQEQPYCSSSPVRSSTVVVQRNTIVPVTTGTPRILLLKTRFHLASHCGTIQNVPIELFLQGPPYHGLNAYTHSYYYPYLQCALCHKQYKLVVGTCYHQNGCIVFKCLS